MSCERIVRKKMILREMEEITKLRQNRGLKHSIPVLLCTVFDSFIYAYELMLCLHVFNQTRPP